MPDIKVFTLDTETTGVTSNSAIVTISGYVIINSEVKEKIDLYIQPHVGADISEEALDVIGYTEEELQNFEHTPAEAYQKLISIFGKYVDRFDRKDKFLVIGHNVQFDCDRLREFFELNGNKYLYAYFGYKFDTYHILGLLHGLKFINWPNVKLENLKSYSKYPFKTEHNAHNSMSDVDLTLELSRVIVKIGISTGFFQMLANTLNGVNKVKL